jgi:hypothetical protein
MTAAPSNVANSLEAAEAGASPTQNARRRPRRPLNTRPGRAPGPAQCGYI